MTSVAVAALAWRTARPYRFWLAGIGAAGAVAALIASPAGHHAAATIKARRQATDSEPLDKTLSDTFPASDAPAVW